MEKQKLDDSTAPDRYSFLLTKSVSKYSLKLHFYGLKLQTTNALDIVHICDQARHRIKICSATSISFAYYDQEKRIVQA